MELSENAVYRVRLSETIAPGDAHAMDVLYHKTCWTRNVRNVLRKHDRSTSGSVSANSSCIASELEFLHVIKEFLRKGNVSCMSDVHTTYLNICSSNGVKVDEIKTRSRKELKNLMQTEIPGVVFTPGKQKNASERISLEETRDAAMWKLEEGSNEHDMKALFKAALAIRSICESSTKWKFDGSMDLNAYEVPEKLALFFKWCLVGKASVTKNISRVNEVSDRSKRLSQILMFECLSSRQAEYSAGPVIKRTRELPLQVGVGLTLHRETRSRKLVDLISRFGLSVTYDRVNEIEGMIATAIAKQMSNTNGIYIPPELKKGKFTHFAADNLDFQEDTPDGKRTLHGTVLVAYQLAEDGDVKDNMKFDDSCQTFSIPECPYNLLPCTMKHNVKPQCKELDKFHNTPHFETCVRDARIGDMTWLLCKDICIKDSGSNQEQNLSGLTWSAHNAVVSQEKSGRTVVAVFPILNRTPTERSVQLTVIDQFTSVKTMLHAPGRRSVITVDLGLYRPMQQLQMTFKTDAILMPGDLHIIMAQLRAIGTFIEGSGIPEIWCESGIYSDVVVKRILQGKPVRRSVEAHIVTLQVLFSFFCDEFYKEHTDERTQCDGLARNLSEISNKKDLSRIKEANDILCAKLKELNIDHKMKAFSTSMSSSRPTFAMAMQYMDMVFSMMAFIKSVRSANWDLRIASLHDFARYFFALDLRNYASMIALHLAEMTSLKKEDPETMQHLQAGLWAPNKSARSFCCLGADEALEQKNRKMKVMGGLVGITLRPKTLTKFFLTAPYSNGVNSK